MTESSYSDRLGSLETVVSELGETYEKPVFEDPYVLSGLLSKFQLAHTYNADLAAQCAHEVMDEWIPFLQEFTANMRGRFGTTE